MIGPGDAFRRYTGQAQRRRQSCPFPLRTEVSVRAGRVDQPPSALNDLAHEPSGVNAVLPQGKPAADEPTSLEYLSIAMASADAATSGGAKAAKATGQGLMSENATGEASEAVAAARAAETNLVTTTGSAVIATSEPGSNASGMRDGAVTEPHKIELKAPMLRPSTIGSGLRIDKSKLWLGLERRIRDKAHLKRVAELPCLICSRQPSHAHHLRFAQRRGMSQKVSDEYVVPLCALHHSELHRSASEQEWWIRQRVDPLVISAQLWARNRSN